MRIFDVRAEERTDKSLSRIIYYDRVNEYVDRHTLCVKYIIFKTIIIFFFLRVDLYLYIYI